MQEVSFHAGSQAGTTPPHCPMTALRLFALSAVCSALLSCENSKSGGSSSDPYASNYGNDGHYNPYPGQSGYTTPTTPSYQTPPMPAEPQPPADPYAFSAPKKSTPSVASSSAPKKSTASSSSTKKKSSSTAAAKKKPSASSRYTVSKGDTLYGIARKKGTTVAKIKAANGISGDVIRPGQSLKIP